mmetsp:Transcript_14233/g.32765  ORF Transcript_14233/g.32765 Transcript_14233/m.32765 type:complete len:382 (-) Transcript_14233:103-1248(-)
MQQIPLGMQNPLAGFAVSQTMQQRCGLQPTNSQQENAQIALGLNTLLFRGIQDKHAGHTFNPHDCTLPGIQSATHMTMNNVGGVNQVLQLGMSSAFTCVRDAFKAGDETSLQSAVQSITASAQAMAQNNHTSLPTTMDNKAQGSDEEDGKKKTLIGAELAARIYAMRPPRTQVGGQFNAAQGLSPTAVGNLFGVSSKVVRDIWNRRTWIEATRSLWSDFEVASHLIEMKTADPDLANKLAKFKPLILKRKPGRPPGAKDFVPRQRRKRDSSNQENSETETSQAPAQTQQVLVQPPTSLVPGTNLASNLQICTSALAQSLVNPVLKLERSLVGIEHANGLRPTQEMIGSSHSQHDEAILNINQADPFASDWQHLLKESDVMV